VRVCLYLSANPSDEDSVSTQIGSDFKDLLRGMLHKSPIARLNLEKVALHPWCCHHGAETKESEANVGGDVTRCVCTSVDHLFSFLFFFFFFFWGGMSYETHTRLFATSLILGFGFGLRVEGLKD
jgi:hypothetical protein